MKKDKNRLRLADLIFQIIPVMIGVFLAFSVSNWAENKRNESKINIFKTNLTAEINSNKNNISKVIDYHIMLRDSSRLFSKKENIHNKPQFFKGVRTWTLTNNAFETGIQTGLINELSLKQIQLINKVYTLQENYSNFTTLILSELMTIDFDENENEQKKIFRFLSVSMTDIVIKENELIIEYEKLLTELNFE